MDPLQKLISFVKFNYLKCWRKNDKVEIKKKKITFQIM